MPHVSGKPLGKTILTTVAENADLLKRILDSEPRVSILILQTFYDFELCHYSTQLFQPSIPNLVYQYTLFTNYESENFSRRNPEIPD